MLTKAHYQRLQRISIFSFTICMVVLATSCGSNKFSNFNKRKFLNLRAQSTVDSDFQKTEEIKHIDLSDLDRPTADTIRLHNGREIIGDIVRIDLNYDHIKYELGDSVKTRHKVRVSKIDTIIYDEALKFEGVVYQTVPQRMTEAEAREFQRNSNILTGWVLGFIFVGGALAILLWIWGLKAIEDLLDGATILESILLIFPILFLYAVMAGFSVLVLVGIILFSAFSMRARDKIRYGLKDYKSRYSTD